MDKSLDTNIQGFFKSVSVNNIWSKTNKA